MNIHDLPIPNFGELEDEAALKLILEVRLRRRIVAQKQQVKLKAIPSEPRRKPKEKKFTSPFGNLTCEQIVELMAALKSSD